MKFKGTNKTKQSKKEVVSKVTQSFVQIMSLKFNYIISDECKAISYTVDELNERF